VANEPPSPSEPEAPPPKEEVPRAQAAPAIDGDIEEDDPPRPLETPQEKDYDPEPVRDKARMWLAYILVFLLCVVIGAAYASLWFMDANNFPNLKTVIELVLGPVVALVGSATGFYFGGGRSGKS
jgi:hypothetical protein